MSDKIHYFDNIVAFDDSRTVAYAGNAAAGDTPNAVETSYYDAMQSYQNELNSLKQERDVFIQEDKLGKAYGVAMAMQETKQNSYGEEVFTFKQAGREGSPLFNENLFDKSVEGHAAEFNKMSPIEQQKAMTAAENYFNSKELRNGTGFTMAVSGATGSLHDYRELEQKALSVQVTAQGEKEYYYNTQSAYVELNAENQGYTVSRGAEIDKATAERGESGGMRAYNELLKTKTVETSQVEQEKPLVEPSAKVAAVHAEPVPQEVSSIAASQENTANTVSSATPQVGKGNSYSNYHNNIRNELTQELGTNAAAFHQELAENGFVTLTHGDKSYRLTEEQLDSATSMVGARGFAEIIEGGSDAAEQFANFEKYNGMSYTNAETGMSFNYEATEIERHVQVEKVIERNEPASANVDAAQAVSDIENVMNRDNSYQANKDLKSTEPASAMPDDVAFVSVGSAISAVPIAQMVSTAVEQTVKQGESHVDLSAVPHASVATQAAELEVADASKLFDVEALKAEMTANMNQTVAKAEEVELPADRPVVAAAPLAGSAPIAVESQTPRAAEVINVPKAEPMTVAEHTTLETQKEQVTGKVQAPLPVGKTKEAFLESALKDMSSSKEFGKKEFKSAEETSAEMGADKFAEFVGKVKAGEASIGDVEWADSQDYSKAEKKAFRANENSLTSKAKGAIENNKGAIKEAIENNKDAIKEGAVKIGAGILGKGSHGSIEIDGKAGEIDMQGFDPSILNSMDQTSIASIDYSAIQATASGGVGQGKQGHMMG